MRQHQPFYPSKSSFFPMAQFGLRIGSRGLLSPSSISQNLNSGTRNSQTPNINAVFDAIRSVADFIALALNSQGQAYHFLQNEMRVRGVFTDSNIVQDAILAINSATPEYEGTNIAATYLENKILPQFGFTAIEESSSSDDDIFGIPKKSSPGAGR